MSRANNNKYYKKLNGFRTTHRNIWFLLENRVLKPEQLITYEFFVDISGFDFNKEDYGQFEINYEEVAKILGYKSDTSIRNITKHLLDLGLIKKSPTKNNFEIFNISRFLIGKDTNGKAIEFAKNERNESIETIFQNYGINSTLIGNNFQNNGNTTDDLPVKTTITSPIIISSYKDRYIGKIYITPIWKSNRTVEDYQEIKSQSNYNLEIEDMMWIDNTIQEEFEVTEENISLLIDNYCNGNINEFEKCLKQPYKNATI